MPLVVQPERGRAVPLGVRPRAPVDPEAPEMRVKANHQVVPLGVQPVVPVHDYAEGVVAQGRNSRGT